MPYLLLSFILLWFNDVLALTVTPNPATVHVGQQLTLTATDVKGNINWSAIRGGKILGSGNTVTYLASDTPGKDVVTVLDDNYQPINVFVVVESKKPAQLSLENTRWEIFTNRDSINTLLLSEDKEFLWVGTSGGLERRNASTGEFIELYTTQAGLMFNNIDNIFSDNQGGFWVITVKDDFSRLGISHKKKNENHFESISKELDLSLSNPNKIYVDNFSNIWFSTDNNLIKVDKNGQFEFFTNEKLCIQATYITTLLTDKQNGLWIGTKNGLAHLNNSKQCQVYTKGNSVIPDNKIQTLLNDEQNGIWIGTENGLAHLNNTGGWQVYNNENSAIPHNNIHSLLTDANDGIWIGTENGLAHINNTNQWQVYTNKNSIIPIDPINEIVSDNRNGIWIKFSKVLIHFDVLGQSQIYTSEKASSLNYEINYFINDGKDGVWLGTNKGIEHYNIAGLSPIYTQSESVLPSNHITSLINNKQRGLWVGTSRGLSYMNINGQWKTYDKNKIITLVTDNHNGVWFSTKFGLGHIDELENIKLIKWTEYGLFEITSLANDNKGGLWAGESYGYLGNLDINGNWKIYNDQSYFFSALFFEKESGLWIGTNETPYGINKTLGLVNLDSSEHLKIYTQANSRMPDNRIQSIISDNNHGLWIGTVNGLAHFKANDEWEIYNTQNSKLSYDYITSLANDNSGGLWIGTFKGLSHLDINGQWQIYTSNNSALADDYITSVSADEQGGVWVGTYSQGIGHLIPLTQSILCIQQQISNQTCQAQLTDQRAAIVIAGGGRQDANNLWYTTSRITNNIYKVLAKRGFQNDEIFYVTPERDADFNGDGYSDHVADSPTTDDPVTLVDIQKALDWAIQRGKLDQPLYLFFVDHGGSDKLQLSKDATLDVSTLNELLNNYQQKTGNEIVLVLDACFSGELGNKLKAPKRAVITSTGNSYAYFNTDTYQGFSRFLVTGLNRGLTFNLAFDYATQEQKKLIEKLPLNNTATGSSGANSSLLLQQPSKTDNNQSYPLDSLYLNIPIATGDATLTVNNTTMVTSSIANQPITLTATASVAQGNVKRVWAVIRPPRMDLVLDQYSTPILAFPQVLLYPVEGQPDHWQATWNDTRYNGEYSLTFYAQDSSGDIVSSDTTTRVTVSQGTNPPDHATTQIKLNQSQYRTGDTLTATVSEELNWGYDLYLAIGLPQGSILTLNNLNDLNAPTLIKPWRGQRAQGQSFTALNMTLPPELPTGQYCFYAVQSPERQDPMQATSQRYWQSSQQCFTLQAQ